MPYELLPLLLLPVLYLLLRGKRIPAAVAKAKLDAGEAVLVDVREAGEWRSGVAGPATLLALSDLNGDRRRWQPFLAANRQKLIILYCASGMRSAHVARKLRGEGFSVANLGGFANWAGRGLPVRLP